jgi:hypothetical protein
MPRSIGAPPAPHARRRHNGNARAAMRWAACSAGRRGPLSYLAQWHVCKRAAAGFGHVPCAQAGRCRIWPSGLELFFDFLIRLKLMQVQKFVQV